MSNNTINNELKNKILKLYFEDNQTMQEISNIVNISRYTISKILHQDNRFIKDKTKRKLDRLRKPQIRKLIFNKKDNSYTVKVSIPYNYIEKLGLNIEDKIVDVKLDENNKRIEITKHK